MSLRIDRSTFVVLDLDDTLYLEADYQKSGFRAVSQLCSEIYGVDPFDQLCLWAADGEQDVFGKLCCSLELPASSKESFIWAYRLHKPSIKLSKGTQDALAKLREFCSGVAILTDGRSVSQKLKLEALGLLEMPHYISEEYGETKTDQGRFKLIQASFQAKHYCYIGDNPAKDFLAPNELGWSTILVEGGEDNIHDHTALPLTDAFNANVAISRFEDILSFLD